MEVKDDIKTNEEMKETIIKLYAEIKEVWLKKSTKKDREHEQANINILTTFLISIIQAFLANGITNLPDIFVSLMKTYEVQMQEALRFLSRSHDDATKKEFINDFCTLLNLTANEVRKLDTFEEKKRIILN